MSYKSNLLFYLTAVTLPLVTLVVGASFSFPLTSETIKIERGKALFEEKCVYCHANEVEATTRMGPSLHEIGALASERVPGKPAAEYIWESIVEPNKFLAADGAMPTTFGSTLTEGELRDLVAYLQSLGGRVGYREILALRLPESTATDPVEKESVSIEEIEYGRSLFFGKFNCHTCHSILDNPGSGLVAPTLHGVGQFSRQHLETSIRRPSETISPRYAAVQCLTIDGEAINGILLSRSEDELLLASGSQQSGLELLRVSPEELEPLGEDVLRPSVNSMMPEWTAALMSDAELEAIVSYLKTLR